MNGNQMIIFNLGSEEYAIDISYTKEIIRIPELTIIPNAPKFVKGVFNLRGTVITVVDLKKRFQMEQNHQSPDSRLLVLEIDDLRMGIIVDDISEVIKTDQLKVQNIGSELTGISGRSIDGIVIINERLILLLNTVNLKKEIFEFCSGREITYDIGK
jgi:purine-binding chemotaxis protein CheW